MTRLHGDKSKIDACMIKENPGDWQGLPANSRMEYMESILQQLEYYLSTRVPDDTFRGIINFEKATVPDTPIDDIEKALVSSQITKSTFSIENKYGKLNNSFWLFYRNICTMRYQKQSVHSSAIET